MSSDNDNSGNDIKALPGEGGAAASAIRAPEH